VVPKSEDCPTSQFQFSISVAVATLICQNFLSPPLGVCFGPSAVLRAAVPEAAVDEDRDLGLQEGDIRSTS